MIGQYVKELQKERGHDEELARRIVMENWSMLSQYCWRRNGRGKGEASSGDA